MDKLYDLALENMEVTLHTLASRVQQPQLVPFGDSFVYRYVERTIHQAVVQKLARVVSGLRAARILLDHGFVQEQAAIQRMINEFHEDITFLTYAIIFEDETDLHREYLAAFYEEEFDNPESAIQSTQRRSMPPRRKIRAYIANSEGAGLDPSSHIELTRTLHSAYSGYIHGASPHIMDMYVGEPPCFHLQGLLGTHREEEYRKDIANYFFRSIHAFAFAAKAFGDEALFETIRKFRDNFLEHSEVRCAP
jgi:hypothetical protein